MTKQSNISENERSPLVGSFRLEGLFFIEHNTLFYAFNTLAR
jgi:hypothetical protein